MIGGKSRRIHGLLLFRSLLKLKNTSDFMDEPNIPTRVSSNNKVKGMCKSVEYDDGLIKETEYVENVSIGRYKILRNLGSGSSSKVVLAFNKETSERVAIKIVSRKHSSDSSPGINVHDDSGDKRIYREVVISSLLNHPHIVRLLDYFYTKDHYFLVFEYIKGRQLYDVVLKNNYISEESARRYFRQILSAIDYIHRNCIVHRDLKIENILIDQNDNVKIIDFGLSNFYDNKNLLGTFCGSLYFAAPELLMGNKYKGPEVDIWSLGVILYVMLCGKVPFDDESVQALQNKIKEAHFEFCKLISAEAKDLILNMLLAIPEGRFGLDQVKKSAWVNLGYDNIVHNYMIKRFPIEKLNKDLVNALSAALSFQFTDVQQELKRFKEVCKDNESLEQLFWTRRPVVSLYYLLAEGFTEKSKCTVKTKMIKKSSRHMPAVLHNFVQFVFSGEQSELYSRYFSKSIFKGSPCQSQSVQNESSMAWPTIRKSYFKGFFRGIKVKNVGSHNALKKRLLDIFKANDVIYEANEKSYFCSYFDNQEECYFKISIYFNIILAEYYMVLTCLNTRKDAFKTISETFKRSLNE